MRSSPDQPPASSETETGAELSENYPPTRILRLKEVIGTIGLGRAAIYQMQREGTFPKPVKIGVRAVGWIAEDVLAWIARRAHRKIATAAHLSEEHDQPRQSPKSGAPPVECQVHRTYGRCIGASHSTNTRSYNGYALSSNGFAKSPNCRARSQPYSRHQQSLMGRALLRLARQQLFA
jgi:prophage regulatory protein